MRRRDFMQFSALAAGIGMFPGGLRAAESMVTETSAGTFGPDLDRIRQLARTMPGPLPRQIRVTKVADTIRPASVVVEGSDPDKKMTLSRTVYQLVYPEGTIMLDSGMDEETHRTFGKTPEPYYPENFEQVKQALNQAGLIILSHYHADHVAGVVRSDKFEQLASKTVISRKTADLMLNKPHKTTVTVSAEQMERFIIADFSGCYPVAPGMVLIEAPGHTPDSTMFYIRLGDGREFIHSIDSGWSMENIRQEKMKNASWVKEDESLLLQQYRWLNQVMKTEKELTVLCTHDNEQYEDYRSKGILGAGLLV